MMMTNYFKIAFRHFRKNSLFSLLNLAGLAVGLAVTILLCLFVTHELRFDHVHEHKKDIYRVLANVNFEGDEKVWTAVPNAVAPAIKEELPEVKYAARMLKHGFGLTAFIAAEDENYAEKSLYWCDPELLKIFSFTFIAGNSDTALDRPNSVVLSESTALKYFGRKNPMGEILTVDNEHTLEVTGVYKDLPADNTLDCNMIATFRSHYFAEKISWGNASFETFCLVSGEADAAGMQTKLKDLVDRVIAPEDQWFSLRLQPLSEVHLYSAGFEYFNHRNRTGDIKEVRNLALLAVLVLLIACINYMNLSTARAQQRIREVGINKTLGASGKGLIMKFYTETGLLTLMALMAGVLLAMAALPLFNAVSGKDLNYTAFGDWKLLAGVLGIWLLTTLLAGAYPAVYLSRFSPKAAMQQPNHRGSASSFIRKGLVISQFTASIILVAGIVVIYQQLQFIRDKKLGYNPENVLAITMTASESREQYDAVEEAFRNQTPVSAVSRAQSFPGVGASGRSLHRNQDDKQGKYIQTNRVSGDILRTLELKLLAGRSLPVSKTPGDSVVQVILNKTAVDYLGYTPEEAIGKKVQAQLGDNAYIVGVTEDFHYESLHKPVGAYALHNAAYEPLRCLLVRFRTGDLPQTMQRFEQVFKKVMPNSAFEYTFLDRHLDTLYEADQRLGRVIVSFSGLAVLVACLGLFGLAAFTAERRNKEIGIRKVLGASVTSVVSLLSKDFIKLVLIAIAVAVPVAWYMMSRWLESFAYRIQLQWWMFVLAGLLAMAVALLTVSFQSVKAALTNPVKSLRSE